MPERCYPIAVVDSFNYLMLEGPQDVGGLQAIAVIGVDETQDVPFGRASGTSPGYILGFVIRAPVGQIES